MIKYIFALILFFTSIVTFSQDFKIEKLNLNQKFYHPISSNNGEYILLTSANYKGLWIYNLINNSIIEISDKNSAGYRPKFSNDDKFILFREDEFLSGRRYSNVSSYRILENDVKVIDEKIRSLSSFDFNKNNFAYLSNGEVKTYSPYNNGLSKNNTLSDFIFENDAEIISNKLSKRKSTDKDFFIWLSIDKNRKKILYTTKGNKTILNDNGQELTIDHANSPMLSLNGEKFVYMNDADNGQEILSSEIFLYDLNNNETMRVSELDEIAMYPSISEDGNLIVYNTINGDIFLVRFNGGRDE